MQGQKVAWHQLPLLPASMTSASAAAAISGSISSIPVNMSMSGSNAANSNTALTGGAIPQTPIMPIPGSAISSIYVNAATGVHSNRAAKSTSVSRAVSSTPKSDSTIWGKSKRESISTSIFRDKSKWVAIYNDTSTKRGKTRSTGTDGSPYTYLLGRFDTEEEALAAVKRAEKLKKKSGEFNFRHFRLGYFGERMILSLKSNDLSKSVQNEAAPSINLASLSSMHSSNAANPASSNTA